ncbi:MAG TPA: FixH family protein [Chondromyces sp.]|nr:FixH family protein [Chondromyces sp.]
MTAVKRSPWPFVIAGALALHVLASLAMVYVATSDPSYAVEEDYYAKSMAWDATRAQERTNADLGWELAASAAPPSEPGAQPVLEVRLSDAAGAPVDGAAVAVQAFHNARSHDIIRAPLQGAGNGLYRATLPMRRDGRWELRFTVDRGTDHFTFSETRHLVVEGRW